jgi:hypothetical protein
MRILAQPVVYCFLQSTRATNRRKLSWYRTAVRHICNVTRCCNTRGIQSVPETAHSLSLSRLNFPLFLHSLFSYVESCFLTLGVSNSLYTKLHLNIGDCSGGNHIGSKNQTRLHLLIRSLRFTHAFHSSPIFPQAQTNVNFTEIGWDFRF